MFSFVQSIPQMKLNAITFNSFHRL